MLLELLLYYQLSYAGDGVKVGKVESTNDVVLLLDNSSSMCGAEVEVQEFINKVEPVLVITFGDRKIKAGKFKPFGNSRCFLCSEVKRNAAKTHERRDDVCH